MYDISKNKYTSILQGSKEWEMLRAQCFNASTIGQIMWYEDGEYKTGDKKGKKKIIGLDNAHNYCYKKVQGQFIDELPDVQKFRNADYGHFMEDLAKVDICRLIGFDYDQFDHLLFDVCDETLLMTSPDMIHKSYEFGFEIKSPTFESGNHFYAINNVRTQDDLKEYNCDYYWQCVSAMYQFELQSYYFVSYLKCVKDEYKLHIIELKRREDEISLLKERLAWARAFVRGISAVKPSIPEYLLKL